MTSSDPDIDTQDLARPRLELWARAGVPPLLVVSPADAEQPPLSERLQIALTDWSEFFTALDGDLGDPEVAHEFVSQGFKLAHRIRAECKGFDVAYIHPVSGEAVDIKSTPKR